MSALALHVPPRAHTDGGADADAQTDATALRIAGMSRFSGVDWPGRLVATLFLQGCPWDCRYCHNPDLIDPHAPGSLSWPRVLAFLRRRRGKLDGVVFSGGEPTMQPSLGAAIAEVRALGFAVGLHTAGAFPAQLASVLGDVDWVGLDIKAAPEDYAAVTARRGSGIHAWRSLRLVLDAAKARGSQGARARGERQLSYEVRTTVHPSLTDAARLRTLGEQLRDAGVEVWALQRARSEGTRPELLPASAPPDSREPDAVARIAAEFAGRFRRLEVR